MALYIMCTCTDIDSDYTHVYHTVHVALAEWDVFGNGSQCPHQPAETIVQLNIVLPGLQATLRTRPSGPVKVVENFTRTWHTDSVVSH